MANQPQLSGLDAANPVASGISAYANIPVTGRTAEENETNIQAAKTASDALQSRFDQPNWFNVAAGFLKPQLGGFAASLGSAAQALGQNEQDRRANEIPVYNARAAVALMQARQSNSLQAQAKLNAWIKDGADINKLPQLKRDFAALQTPDFADAAEQHLATTTKIKESNDATIRILLDKATRLDAIAQNANSTPAQKLEAQQQYNALVPQLLEQTAKGKDPSSSDSANPVLDVNDAKAAAAKAASATSTAAQPAPSAAPVISPSATVSSTSDLTPAAKTEMQKDNLVQGRDYIAGMQIKARDAQSQFSELAGVYPLFSDPGVKMAMGQFNQGTLDSVMKTMLANQSTSPSLSAVAQLISPAVEAKYPGTISKLQTLIGLAARQQLDVNNATQNPTRGTQALEKSVVFGPNDLADVAARKVLTSMHALKHVYAEANTLAPLSGTPIGLSDIQTLPQIKTLHDNWARRQKMLQSGTLYKNLPLDLQSIDAPIPAPPKSGSTVGAQLGRP